MDRSYHFFERASERRLWLRQLYAGLAAYVGVGVAGLVYCAGTWTQGPNRGWLALLVLLTLASVPLLWFYRRRLVARRRRLWFFVAWNMTSYLAVMIGCILDGGISSPIVFVWFLPTIYLLLGYPRNAILVCAPFGIGLYLIAALVTPPPFPYSLFALQLLLLSDSLLLVLLGALAREQREKRMVALRDQLSVMASTDHLTGCLNQRAFARATVSEVARAARFKHDVSLLAMDVDNFKDINDAYGHIVGDKVLRQLGTALRATIRQTDIAGRLGGDELAVLCPETDSEAAIHLAERFQTAVEEISRETKVSLSIGICTMQPTAEGPELLRYRADQALYAAKRQGRNQYVVFKSAA